MAYFRILCFLGLIFGLGLGHNGAVRAQTGVLEVTSEPAGATLVVNGETIGKTPYADPFIEVGTYTITAILTEEFPPQRKTIVVDQINPVSLFFEFESGLEGTFAGKKESALKTEKKTGDIQFASVPTGATVVVDGATLGTTPFGYTEVEIGDYSASFTLGDRTVSGPFRILEGKPEKLVAIFRDGEVISVNAAQEATTDKTAFGTPVASDTEAESEESAVALIRLLQDGLKARGCRAGVSDGIWGKRSASALNRFNQQRGDMCEALEDIEPISRDAKPDPQPFKENLARLKGCSAAICTYPGARKPRPAATEPRRDPNDFTGRYAAYCVQPFRRGHWGIYVTRQGAINIASRKACGRSCLTFTCFSQYCLNKDCTRYKDRYNSK